ncbi:hypothetical protein OKW40_000822 [Paraburkholderia sp. RAU6.4a]
MKKEYFRSKTEFPCGPGEISTEFIDGVATRQISHPDGGVAYTSSSIQDWNRNIGYLLFDGARDELDIPTHDQIEQDDFELAWKAAVNNPPREPAIIYEVGDAAVPQKDSTLLRMWLITAANGGVVLLLLLVANTPLHGRVILTCSGTNNGYRLDWFNSYQ